jgi:hypothetical protein
MQSPDALRALWSQRGDISDESRPIVATCGSGAVL